MLWVALWAALVLLAVLVLGLLGRSLWRTSKALTRELGVASDRLAQISDSLAIPDSVDADLDARKNAS